MAQLVAHLLCKQGVRGSSPLGSTRALIALLLVAALVSCGDDTGGASSGTGVSGRVLLGPTCPVEEKGKECDDTPAISVDVAVHEPSAEDPMTLGEVVAQASTEDDGSFRIDVEPGAYLVTATAGMFCQVTPVNVVDGEYAVGDVPCDTGIR